MDNKDQLEILLETLGWNHDLILKPRRSNSPAITAQQFLTNLINNETIVATSKALNCGQQTLNRLIEKHLIPKFGKLNGGNETWLYKLRSAAKIKKCCSCKQVLRYSEFNIDSSNSDGLYAECKPCRVSKNEQWYTKNVDYHKQYLQDNRANFVANNAKRRAAKVLATVKWANLEKIKEVYESCPVGYHVDHIYPLQSDWVCGLHTVENLQILPEKENLSKGNRYIEDIHV